MADRRRRARGSAAVAVAALCLTGPTCSAETSQRPDVPIATFGRAVGDGSDATAAIAGAFGALDAPVVRFPVGTFAVSTCRTLDAASSVSLIGSGRGKTVIRVAASTCSGGLFQWTQASQVAIRGLTIDMNGATAATATGILSFLADDDVLIDEVDVINVGSGPFYAIAGNGAYDVTIQNSRCVFKAAATSANQCVNSSNSFRTAKNWTIRNNVFINSGAFYEGDDFKSSGNDISGWAFGGGITIGSTTSDSKFSSDNDTVHDSGTALDVNHTFPAAVEASGFGQIITNGGFYNVADSCVVVRGQHSMVARNHCHGWGKGVATGRYKPDMAAYTDGYVTPSVNGSHSLFLANKATVDGSSSHALYGYADQPEVTDVTIRGGALEGVVAPTRIVGGTTMINVSPVNAR